MHCTHKNKITAKTHPSQHSADNAPKQRQAAGALTRSISAALAACSGPPAPPPPRPPISPLDASTGSSAKSSMASGIKTKSSTCVWGDGRMRNARNRTKKRTRSRSRQQNNWKTATTTAARAASLHDTKYCNTGYASCTFFYLATLATKERDTRRITQLDDKERKHDANHVPFRHTADSDQAVGLPGGMEEQPKGRERERCVGRRLPPSAHRRLTFGVMVWMTYTPVPFLRNKSNSDIIGLVEKQCFKHNLLSDSTTWLCPMKNPAHKQAQSKNQVSAPFNPQTQPRETQGAFFYRTLKQKHKTHVRAHDHA